MILAAVAGDGEFFTPDFPLFFFCFVLKPFNDGLVFTNFAEGPT